MKVKNPNPCLVNVAGTNGKFIRIGPLQVADVDAKAVERLLKTGALIKASASDDETAISSGDAELASAKTAAKK
jgi:hypothetical protein